MAPGPTTVQAADGKAGTPHVLVAERGSPDCFDASDRRKAEGDVKADLDLVDEDMQTESSSYKNILGGQKPWCLVKVNVKVSETTL